MNETTCQICARDIKANTGTIAHHGYQRPDRGSGWQTASCMGARHLPYEQSRDLIPSAIEQVRVFIKNQQTRRRELLNTPPATMTIISFYQDSKTVTRPEGFDPKVNTAKENYSYKRTNMGTYEHEHYHQFGNAEREIRFAKMELTRLQNRYDAWVAPI